MSDGTPIMLGDDMTEAELAETAEVAREHAENARTARWVARMEMAENERVARLRAWHAENQRLGL